MNMKRRKTVDMDTKHWKNETDSKLKVSIIDDQLFNGRLKISDTQLPQYVKHGVLPASAVLLLRIYEHCYRQVKLNAFRFEL